MKTLFIVAFSLFANANYTGERILQAAQRYGMTDAELKYLMSNTSPDLTLKDKRLGATALIHSCIKNRPNMVLLLVTEGGAEINETDNNGETCLIGAVKNGNKEVVQILLDLGADTSIVGKDNKAPYDHAVQMGKTEIAKMLGGPPKIKRSFSDSDLVTGPKKNEERKKLIMQRWKNSLKIGRVSLILKNWSSTDSGEDSIRKLEEITKVVGINEDTKREMESRRLQEERIRKEEELKKLNEKKVFIAKLKALAAFNNLYLNVSNNEVKKAILREYSGEASFNDEVSRRIFESEQKIKKLEEEFELLKKKDIEIGAKERLETLKKIIQPEKKNEQSIQNEPEEMQEAKLDAIQDLLDVKESKARRDAALRSARKKIAVLSSLKKFERRRLESIEEEEEDDLRKAKLLERSESEKRKASLENQKKKEKEQLELSIQELVNKKREEKIIGKKPVLKRLIETTDFTVLPLTKNDCVIRKSHRGNLTVVFSKLKIVNIVETQRSKAIWFINRFLTKTLPDGGSRCAANCYDAPVYRWDPGKREHFFPNLTVKLGPTNPGYIEIYSSVKGNKTIRVPIDVCLDNN